ncbi:MAG: hypothetical protein CMP11_00705 [Zetaproteobacteria bacterium]|nr:hypothetical protein [Pseudobdellovibrionaceae bacterium]
MKKIVVSLCIFLGSFNSYSMWKRKSFSLKETLKSKKNLEQKKELFAKALEKFVTKVTPTHINFMDNELQSGAPCWETLCLIFRGKKESAFLQAVRQEQAAAVNYAIEEAFKGEQSFQVILNFFIYKNKGQELMEISTGKSKILKIIFSNHKPVIANQSFIVDQYEKHYLLACDSYKEELVSSLQMIAGKYEEIKSEIKARREKSKIDLIRIERKIRQQKILSKSQSTTKLRNLHL